MKALAIICTTLCFSLGCGKKEKSTAAAGGPRIGTETQENVGGGGGAGTQAGRRSVGRVLNDHEAGQFAMALEAGMNESALNIPGKAQVQKMFKGQAGYENIVAMLEAGELVWLDNAPRGGMWAYTKNPDNNKSHSVIVGGKVQRMSTYDLEQQLGRKP
jgi:hypothetical protein